MIYTARVQIIGRSRPPEEALSNPRYGMHKNGKFYRLFDCELHVWLIDAQQWYRSFEHKRTEVIR